LISAIPIKRYCVIGAGPSGLAVARRLCEAGIAFDCFERNDDVGGNWYFGKPGSSVYASTHLISSKRLTEFADYPMPAEFPPFPHHSQAWEYLRCYARNFGLYERIALSTGVERVEPHGERWQVTLSTGERREYAGIIIANGHNWRPRWPALPGVFDGLSLHSSQYKTPDVLTGKRVLVVGAGNSGCDIAVEAAQYAAAAFHSIRRGYHYLPKFVAGRPVDEYGELMLRLRVPLWLRRLVTRYIARLTLGSPQRFGLPKPDHRFWESHPIINSQLLYYVGHGRIRVKPDIVELRGDRVAFADGSEETIDVIVYATGFEISFPFIDREQLNWRDGRPDLYLNIFHPRHERLLLAGLIQPDSGQWGLVDVQAQLISRYLAALDQGHLAAKRFQSRVARGDGARRRIDYIASPRHLLEVEHYSYRRRLEEHLHKFQ
jgi:cation diffusion facilitator CzcD-associated flavoprotein CzcO